MVRVKKSELIDYDLEGITIMYNNKEWRIPYGKFVSKVDIDNATDDTYIYIAKYGRWVVARVGEKKDGDYAREKRDYSNASNSHRSVPNLNLTLEKVQEIVSELDKRVSAIEERLNAIEVKMREW